MKIKSLLALLLLAFSWSAFAGNYVLIVDGKKYELSLGEESQVVVDGKSLSVLLEQKALLRFESGSFSFEYPRGYTPAKSEVDAGLLQTTVMTPLGSVVLVQEYLSMSPVGLIDLMVREITKEEREYGYEITAEDKVIKLADGKELTGKLVKSKYSGSDIERFIGAYGERDSGVLVMTQVDYAIDEDSSTVIEQIIGSLSLKD